MRGRRLILDQASRCVVSPAFAVQRSFERVGAADFLARAHALAGRLPPNTYVINACENRFEFLVVWYAALLRGKINLLPSSRSEAAFQKLEGHYPESFRIDSLSDRMLLSEPVSGRVAGPCDTTIAAILFTSGSTGEPRAQVKTWGQMVIGAERLKAQFSMKEGASVVATVPPQHMFGFETTAMLPVTQGFTVLDATPLLPADVEVAVHSSARPRWLVTTPLHLRSLRGAGVALKGLDGVISATMPLEPADATFLEDHWGTPIFEIYGSTETGMIGYRRPACEVDWQLCDDLVWSGSRKVAVSGARLAGTVQLSDVIERLSPRRFRFVSRADDMVKVAGKRASLAALNGELGRIPGVVDGTFFAPDGGARGAPRLAAFVVAPNTSRDAILAQLRHLIDPAFLPRPLVFVDALPRNALGKLPRAAVEEMARAEGLL